MTVRSDEHTLVLQGIATVARRKLLEVAIGFKLNTASPSAWSSLMDPIPFAPAVWGSALPPTRQPIEPPSGGQAAAANQQRPWPARSAVRARRLPTALCHRLTPPPQLVPSVLEPPPSPQPAAGQLPHPLTMADPLLHAPTQRYRPAAAPASVYLQHHSNARSYLRCRSSPRAPAHPAYGLQDPGQAIWRAQLLLELLVLHRDPAASAFAGPSDHASSIVKFLSFQCSQALALSIP